MNAWSIKGTSPEEIKAALTDCIADGFKPTLCLVFLTAFDDIDTVSARDHCELTESMAGGFMSTAGWH